MTKCILVTHLFHHKYICRALLLLALLLGVCVNLLQPQVAKAHGGVIMDGGFSPDYEWLVLSVNSPLVEGPNLMSFVIYDINTYEPVNGMRVEVLISHQSSEVPCCNADDHLGPFELEADPEEWPGDYSYPLPLENFGNFELKFTAYKGDSDEPAIEAISQFLVLPDLSKITPEPNPDAQEPPGSGPVSPLPAPQSPLPEPTKNADDELNNPAETPTAIVTPEPTETAPGSGGTTAPLPETEGDTLLDRLRSQWMIWAAAGLIPLALLAFLLFRPSMDELIAQKEAELETASDETASDETELDEEPLDD